VLVGNGPSEEQAAVLLRPPEHPVHGSLFLPVDGHPSVAVLLIGGSGGSEPSYAGQALAREGFAALSLAFFARPRLAAQLRDIPLEYFLSAIDWLRQQPTCQDLPLVVVGMSRGREAAMLIAVHAREPVAAVVASVPGNVVLCSFPAGGPAWLLGGRALPYVSKFGPDCDDEKALIPVERIPGPVLLVAAGADKIWPSGAMARALSERLRAHGDPHGHQLVLYPEAGHSLGYLVPSLPPSLLPNDLADTAANNHARRDAWPKVLRFIGGAGDPPPAFNS
jgi:dienelactone hydrolase